jgi:phosphate uptake regulator
MDDRLDDIRFRLEQIAEELGDVAIDLLREAVDAGAGRRPPEEKPISQARRAVDKAARHLASISSTAVD